MFSHEEYMRLALAEARAALDDDEVPVGAVIVRRGRVIAAAHNQRETLRDPTAHAEMIAITQAAQSIGDWRLDETALYVTLEPCAMCAGAIVLARVPVLVFGAWDPKAGACGSLFSITTDRRLNHHVELVTGVLEPECGNVLKEFFSTKRRASREQ
jgi:tRNA(adenine34) deaminase